MLGATDEIKTLIEQQGDKLDQKMRDIIEQVMNRQVEEGAAPAAIHAQQLLVQGARSAILYKGEAGEGRGAGAAEAFEQAVRMHPELKEQLPSISKYVTELAKNSAGESETGGGGGAEATLAPAWRVALRSRLTRSRRC